MEKQDKDLTINERFSLMRTRLKLSRAAVGEAAGISGTSIGNIENGVTKSPNSDVLSAVSTNLRINLEWLILGDGPMQKGQQPESAGLTSGAATVAESETILKLAVAEATLEQTRRQLADKDKLIDRLWSLIPAKLGKLMSSLEAAHGVRIPYSYGSGVMAGAAG